MGKIDEDYSGTTIPNYDTPTKKHDMNEMGYCNNCGMSTEEMITEDLKFCDSGSLKKQHDQEQKDSEYNTIHERENDSIKI